MSDSKRTLVQIVLSLGAGGTERLVIDMSLALSARFDVHVICLDERGDWAGELSDAGIPVAVLGRRPGFDLRLVTDIRAVLRRFTAPVVHCHHYTPFVYGTLAALGIRGARVVYTEHGRYDDGRPSRKRRVANAVLGRLPGRFFAVSHDLRKHLIAEGFPARRMEVNHNGITLAADGGDTSRASARRALGMPADDWVVGTVARLHPVKNLEMLLDAFAALPRRSDTRLVLVGDGESREALEARSRELGLNDRVVFAGQREDARALLHAFDVYVNCSIIEGISVTILEAMAACCPVVATAVGGTPEIVTHDRDGILVASRSIGELSAALADLRARPQHAAALGRAGRQRVEQEFSNARMIERYLHAYGEPSGSA